MDAEREKQEQIEKLKRRARQCTERGDGEGALRAKRKAKKLGRGW